MELEDDNINFFDFDFTENNFLDDFNYTENNFFANGKNQNSTNNTNNNIDNNINYNNINSNVNNNIDYNINNNNNNNFNNNINNNVYNNIDNNLNNNFNNNLNNNVNNIINNVQNNVNSSSINETFLNSLEMSTFLNLNKNNIILIEFLDTNEIFNENENENPNLINLLYKFNIYYRRVKINKKIFLFFNINNFVKKYNFKKKTNPYKIINNYYKIKINNKIFLKWGGLLEFLYKKKEYVIINQITNIKFFQSRNYYKKKNNNVNDINYLNLLNNVIDEYQIKNNEYDIFFQKMLVYIFSSNHFKIEKKNLFNYLTNNIAKIYKTDYEKNIKDNISNLLFNNNKWEKIILKSKLKRFQFQIIAEELKNSEIKIFNNYNSLKSNINKNFKNFDKIYKKIITNEIITYQKFNKKNNNFKETTHKNFYYEGNIKQIILNFIEKNQLKFNSNEIQIGIIGDSFSKSKKSKFNRNLFVLYLKFLNTTNEFYRNKLNRIQLPILIKENNENYEDLEKYFKNIKNEINELKNKSFKYKIGDKEFNPKLTVFFLK